MATTARVTWRGLAAGNSPAALAERTRTRQLGWAGPLVMVVGRTALAVLAQGLAAGVLWLRGSAAPWHDAAAGWTVWGTLADLACLGLLYWLLRREGLRLRDLVGLDRSQVWPGVARGVLYFLVVFPLAIIGGTLLSSWLVFGTLQAPLYGGELTGRVLPLWARLYSVGLWWVLWSPTEELTYNGYALPRLAVLSRRPWAAVLLVGLAWAVQHAALPLLFDLPYLLWRTLSFLPLCVVMAALYLRTRWLWPLIVTHWLMDIIGAVTTIAW